MTVFFEISISVEKKISPFINSPDRLGKSLIFAVLNAYISTGTIIATMLKTQPAVRIIFLPESYYSNIFNPIQNVLEFCSVLPRLICFHEVPAGHLSHEVEISFD